MIILNRCWAWHFQLALGLTLLSASPVHGQGTYGSPSSSAVVTTNAQKQITAISNASITPNSINAVNKAGDTIPAGSVINAPTAARGTNNGQFTTTGFAAAQSPCTQINDYGGDPTGGSASDSALISAWSVNPGQVCVEFGPGTYKFSSQDTYIFASNNQSLVLKGQGPGVSNVYWPSTSGIQINFADQQDVVTIEGLTFLTGTTGQTALKLSQKNGALTGLGLWNLILNVQFQGLNLGSNAWGYGVFDYLLSNINFDKINCMGEINHAPDYGIGTCLYFTGVGGSNAQYATAFNISQFNAWAVQYGIYADQYTQGFNISNGCNFTFGQYGVFQPNGVLGPYQLTVSGCAFNLGRWAVYDGSVGTPSLNLSNNTMIEANTDAGYGGFYVNSCFMCVISGNSFSGGATPATPSGIGVQIHSNYVANGYPRPGTIYGNNFLNLSQGLLLDSGTQFNYVSANEFVNDILGYSNGNVYNNIAQLSLSADFAPSPVLSGGGLGSSPTFSGSNGTAAGQIKVGSSPSSASFTLTMPASVSGWSCSASDLTHNSSIDISQTGSSTTLVYLQPYARGSTSPAAMTAGDYVNYQCRAF